MIRIRGDVVEKKFRSWNEKQQLFYYFVNGRYLNDKGNSPSFQTENYAHDFDWNNAEQYTGLRDNSTELKELYHGDILQSEDGSHFEIFWSDGAWMLYDDEEFVLLRQSLIDANFMVLVGNTNQNPELIK
jgi:hypothetical protein